MPAFLNKSGLFLMIAAVFSNPQTPWQRGGDKPSGWSVLHAQTPTPTVVDSPNVKVLTGLLAPDFQEEMNHMVQGVGGSWDASWVARGALRGSLSLG